MAPGSSAISRGDESVRDYDIHDRTVGHVLADKAARIGDRPFLYCAGVTYSYGQLEEMTNRYANGFAAMGVGRGTHVAVILPNCPEFFWTIWGLAKLGAVAVPLNTSAKGELLRYFLDQSDTTVVCVSAPWLDRVAAVLHELPDVQDLLVHDGPATEVGGRRVGRLEDLALADASAPRLETPVTAADPHLILYTSGTTGPSKGAVSPQSQGHAVGRQMASINGYRSDDVLYTCLPVFHGNALWYTVYAALWAEAPVALYPQFSARRFWDEVRESHATIINCLGAMANIIWQQPPSPRDRDHGVRICMMVPTSEALSDGFRERFGITVTSVYAMTENCAVTIFAPDDPPAKVPSAGRMRDYMSIQICDDEGYALPVGEVGEIQVRPNEPGIVMHGYYQLDDATVEATRDLWFRTGDRGQLDEDGYLYFTDRKKEAIRRRGENISAFEVESILCAHPDVVEAAAVPVQSELSEDDVMVYVVRAAGSDVTYEQIIAHCDENMPYFMVPRYVEFIDELPKTPSEKVEKYKLKMAAAASIEQLWDREAAGITITR